MKRATRRALHGVLAFVSCLLFCATKGEVDVPRLCSTSDKKYVKLFAIHENSPNGTFIGQLDVVTSAEGQDGDAQLFLKKSDKMCGLLACDQWVNFDPASQNLSLIVRDGAVLDRDSENGVSDIDLIVMCQVRQGDEQASPVITVEVSIKVIDVNDNDPVFVGEPYHVTISELSLPGSNVINVSATDDDRLSHLSYRILPGQISSEYFAIPRAMTGEIELEKMLDYEALAKFNRTRMDLKVEVINRGKSGNGWKIKRNVTTVKITVQDEDDQPPAFGHCEKIAGVCVLTEYSAVVQENTVMTRSLVLKPEQIHAYDPDTQIRQPIRYSLLYATPIESKASFLVSPNSGEINLLSKLPVSDGDREYVLYVKASQRDNRDMFNVARVRVKLVKVANDIMPPQILGGRSFHGYTEAGNTDPATFVQSTSSGSLLRLAVTDPDYSEDEQPEFVFSLEPIGGRFEITTQGYLVANAEKLRNSEEHQFEVKVVAENPDFCREETRYSDPVVVKITNRVSSRMFSRNTSSTQATPTQPSNQAFVALFGIFLGLFILCVPIIIYLFFTMRRYKDLSQSTARDPYMTKQSFGQRYDAFSFNNSTFRDRSVSFASSAPTTASKGAASDRNMKLGHVVKTPTIDDDVPHIAPLEAIRKAAKKAEREEGVAGIVPYRSDSPQRKEWIRTLVENPLNFDQIRVENWLSEKREKKCGVGEVSLGSPRPCLVKILTEHFRDKEAASHDVAAMQHVLHYKVCRHPNIVRFYGCCFQKSSLYIVNEFVSSRDLRTVLVSSRMQDHSAVISTLSGAQLLSFVLGIAEGLFYLHENGVLHGALRAKNVRVNDTLTVKLAECCSETAQRYKLKSKRWAAPEIISDGHYTSKSDIWAFGVLIWEIVSLGGVPFHELSDSLISNHVIRLLRTGSSILPVTRNTTKRLWMLLQKCWCEDPLDRPNIHAMKSSLAAMKVASNAITVARAPGYRFFPTSLSR